MITTDATTRDSRRGRPLGLSRDNAWLAVSTLLYGASVGFYQYVLPIYIAQFGATPEQVGLALAVGNSGGIVGLIIGGAIVNRYNLRYQIILSWLMAAIAGVFFVFAWSWEIVAFGILLSSVALFGLPAFSAYIVLARDGQDTIEALTLTNVSFTAGSALTPALGGWIIASAGMRPMFVASLVAIVASTVAAVAIKNRIRPTGESHSPGDVLLGARRLLAPIRTYRDALAVGAVRGLLAVLTIIYVATFVGVSLLPNYFMDRLGLDAGVIGALGTGAAVVGVAASLGLARLSRWIGVYRALAIAQGMLVVGFALALTAPSAGSLAILLGGAGFALRGALQAQQSLARAMITFVAPTAHLGPCFALLSIVFNLAITVGPAIAGVLYSADPALPLVVALIVSSPLLAWLASRPVQSAKREPVAP